MATCQNVRHELKWHLLLFISGARLNSSAQFQMVAVTGQFVTVPNAPLQTGSGLTTIRESVRLNVEQRHGVVSACPKVHGVQIPSGFHNNSSISLKTRGGRGREQNVSNGRDGATVRFERAKPGCGRLSGNLSALLGDNSDVKR